MRHQHRRLSASSSSRRFNFLLLAAASVATPSLSHAQTLVSWIGTTGTYTDGSNWSSNSTPTNAANEFLLINNGGTALVPNGGEGAFLHLGLAPGDTGSLQVTGGTLTLGELRVGGRHNNPLLDILNPPANGGGTGSVLQTGGTVSVTYSTGTEPPIQSLYVGDSGLASGNTANGSYTIQNNAVLLVGIANNDQLVIGTGAGAHGTFIQQGTSSVTSTGHVIVGRTGATASYTLSGGALQVGDPNLTVNNMNLFVGDGVDSSGTGVVAGTSATFTQTAGSVTTRNGIDVGRRGGTGTYNISGGTINTSSEFRVGSNGSSAEAAHQTGNGTLNVSNTANITIGTNLHVGIAGAAVQNTVVGAMNMTGGTISLPASNAVFAVGNGRGSSGSATISGGTITMNGTTAVFDIGRNNASGSVEISGNANVQVNDLRLNSANVAGNRELTVKGGTLTIGNWEQGGGDTVATRTFTQTGGTVSVTSPSFAHRAGRNVIYNLSGGSFSMAGTIPWDTSTLNVSGSANVSFNNVRTGGVVSGFTGTFNITGGSLTAANVNDSTANAGGVVNISNGTVNVPGTWNITNNNPGSGAVAGQLNITGGNVTINNLVTYANRPAANTNTATLLYISGGALNIPSLTLSSNTTIKTDNAIALNSSVLVGNATADVSSGSLNLTGPFTVNGPDGRTLTKTGAGALTISGPQTYTTPGTLTVSNGTLNLNSSSPGNLTVNANSATNFNASQTLTALNVADGVVSTLTANGSRSITTAALNLNSSGTLDLTNNSLNLTDPGAQSTVVSKLQSAFNNGAWDGPGLTSSTARNRADNGTGLAWSNDGTTLTVLYTWSGDLNLDKKLNGDDFALIDRHRATSGFGAPATWQEGDVNYDGLLTTADYVLVDTGYAASLGAPLSPAFLAMRESQFGSDYVAQLTAAVPEPSSLALLTLATLPLARRRRH